MGQLNAGSYSAINLVYSLQPLCFLEVITLKLQLCIFFSVCWDNFVDKKRRKWQEYDYLKLIHSEKVMKIWKTIPLYFLTLLFFQSVHLACLSLYLWFRFEFKKRNLDKFWSWTLLYGINSDIYVTLNLLIELRR